MPVDAGILGSKQIARATYPATLCTPTGLPLITPDCLVKAASKPDAMMLQVFSELALLALSLGVAGFYLALFGDVIAEKTGLGSTWVGLAMMATVTSLPELVTGISAVTIEDAPDIALGDAVGSCIFNLLLIVLLDFLHRGASVYTRLSQGHILSAGFGVILLGLVAFTILLGDEGARFSLGHISIATPIIVAFYLIAVYTVFQYERSIRQDGALELTRRHEHLSLAKALSGYLLAALVVLASGIRLPTTASHIVVVMGWDETFVGTFFVALATSLPEVAVTVSAIRLGAIDLAMSGLFGSNLFDLLIMAIDDLAYTRGPLFAAVSPLHLVSIQTAMMMTGIAIVGLLYRPTGRILKTVGWVSLLILMFYVIDIAVLYLSQDGWAPLDGLK